MVMVRFRVEYPQVTGLAGLGSEMISHLGLQVRGSETYRVRFRI